MNVIILAAGMGNRLGDATRALPKALVEVEGRPLLDYVMNFLDHPAVGRITVVGGYQFARIRDFLKAHYPKVAVIENPQYMRGSILTIEAGARDMHGDTLIMNTDHIYPRRLLDKLIPQCREITAVCDSDRGLVEDDMKVQRNSSGNVADIDKRLLLWDAGYIGMTFCAAAKIGDYRAAIAGALKTRGDEVAVEASLRLMAQQGKAVHVADVSGIGWLEVDTPADSKAAEEILRTTPGFLA